METFLTVIVPAIVGGLIGGGSVVRLFMGALENRLRDVFSTSLDLMKVRDHLTAVETIARSALDAAGAAHSKALDVERISELKWVHSDDRFDEALDRLNEATKKLEKFMERLVRLETRTGTRIEHDSH